MTTPVFASQDFCECPPGELEVKAPTDHLGTMTQLLAMGPQDTHLCLDPEITFWKTFHQTYFYFESWQVDVPFDRELSSPPYEDDRYAFFGSVSTLHVADIPLDQGDVLGALTLHIQLSPITQGLVKGVANPAVVTTWVESVAFAMIDTVQFSVDGQVLQTMSGKAIYVMSETDSMGARREGYNRMTGKGVTYDGQSPVELYLPLPFWFCRTDDLTRPGFPLCSLRRGSKVQVSLRIRPWSEVVRTKASGIRHTFPDLQSSLAKVRLVANLARVDRDQALMFRHGYQEFLIEQTQEQVEIIEAGNHDFKREILVSRATKAIFFILQDLQEVTGDSVLGNRWTSLGTYDLITQRANADAIRSGVFPPPLLTAQIYLSNEEREPRAPSLPGSDEDKRVFFKYYSLVQPFYSDGAIPGKGVYCYYFSLAPFSMMPTGHYDLSTSTNLIHLRTTERVSRRLQLTIFTVSYNIMELDGQGEVALRYID
jgi:hypothetical protein